MEKTEELLKLFKEATEKIKIAEEEYFKTRKEESQKLKAFFEANKNEIAIPFKFISKKESLEELSRNIHLTGYNNGHFSLITKEGEVVKLTEDIVNNIVFIDDDSKDLFNTIQQESSYKNEAYNRLLLGGKYAVIIFPSNLDKLWRYNYLSPETLEALRRTESHSIYIGKMIFEKWRFADNPDICFHDPNEKGEHFPVVPDALLDSIVFDNANDFNLYISKYGFKNGMKTDLKELPKTTKGY